jgi:peptidyl-prolyl cis-trans isomerase A (cyclophilin A)/peptidyl-prolyl cis-trans isomerase B (cyclophilin B)
MARSLRRAASHLVTWLALACAFVTAHTAAAANPQVEFKTSMGAVVIELYPDKAPATVNNFLQYVKDGHYDGTMFHRVVPGFVVQGGGFDKNGQQKPTRAPIKNEAANGLKNLRGTLSMARTADPESATAQFFINLQDNPMLDFRDPSPRGIGYAVFGKVVDGMEVVDKMLSVPRKPMPYAPDGSPVTPIVVESARIVETK